MGLFSSYPPKGRSYNISGGVSGAITNQETLEAQQYAITEYERIRNDKYDIEKIAQNTAFDELQIEIIKNYLFYQKHKLTDNHIKRFDPDFYIAQSWHRLAYEPHNIKEHDLLLLEHEAMELSLVMQGTPQQIAHDITEKKYNYTKAAENYYSNLRISQNRQHKETAIDWQAMLKLKILQEQSEFREDSKHEDIIRGGKNYGIDEKHYKK